VVTFDPRPEVYAVYDGLVGLSSRPVLAEILEALRAEPVGFRRFTEALQKKRSARLLLYFTDYVSYGLGGGDAMAEFPYRTQLLLFDSPSTEFPSGSVRRMQLQPLADIGATLLEVAPL
jgi:hypothetical protein